MHKSVQVQDYEGSWDLIDTAYYLGEKVGLYEHEDEGDELFYLILDANGNLIRQTWNGFSDLR